MRAMRALVSIFLLSGCASGLRMTINDDVIASLSPQDKAGITDAQKELSDAQKEQQKLHADVTQTNGLVKQCDTECDNAEKAAGKAIEDQKKAEQAGDMQQVNTANKNKEVTAAAQRATEAKREFLQRKQRAVQAGSPAERKNTPPNYNT